MADTKKRSRQDTDDNSDTTEEVPVPSTKKIRLPTIQKSELYLPRDFIAREIKQAVSDALQNEKEKNKEDYDGPLLIFSPLFDFFSSLFEKEYNLLENIDNMIIKKAGDVLQEKRYIYKKKLVDIDFPIITTKDSDISDEEIDFIDYTVKYPQKLNAATIESIPFLHPAIIAVQLCPSSLKNDDDDDNDEILSYFTLRIHISVNYIIKNKYVHAQLNTPDVPQQSPPNLSSITTQGFNYEKAIAALLVSVFGSSSVFKEDSSKVGSNYTQKDKMIEPYSIYKVKIKLPISIWQIKKMLAYSINALCFFPVQGSRTECFIEFEVPT